MPPLPRSARRSWRGAAAARSRRSLHRRARPREWLSYRSACAMLPIYSRPMLHLGSIGKTSIDVDFSFFILITLFVILGYDESKGIEYALIWIPILFVSVLFHEFAHAAAIALFGFGAS